MLLIGEHVGNDHLNNVVARGQVSAKFDRATSYQSLHVGLLAGTKLRLFSGEYLRAIVKQFYLRHELWVRSGIELCVVNIKRVTHEIATFEMSNRRAGFRIALLASFGLSGHRCVNRLIGRLAAHNKSGKSQAFLLDVRSVDELTGRSDPVAGRITQRDPQLIGSRFLNRDREVINQTPPHDALIIILLELYLVSPADLINRNTIVTERYCHYVDCRLVKTRLLSKCQVAWIDI